MNIKDYNAPVSDNVIRIIDAQGLKQKHIAEKMGVHQQTLSDMLRGRKLIKACDTKALANALGVDANELYRE